MISLIVAIAVVGLIVWALTTYVPMPPAFKTAIVVIAVVCLVLFVLQAFGLLVGVHDVPVPQLGHQEYRR